MIKQGTLVTYNSRNKKEIAIVTFADHASVNLVVLTDDGRILFPHGVTKGNLDGQWDWLNKDGTNKN